MGLKSKYGVEIEGFQMEDDRKNAYRYLLYWGMLEIRPIAWLNLKWWKPFTLTRELRRVREAGALADALHNLGFYAAYDFQNFDEEWFWDDIESIKSRHPEFNPEKYRNFFQRRLNEFSDEPKN